MKNKRNYIIKMSLRKKIKSKWFLGINIFIFIIMLLTININTIINMFGGDYKEEKVIEVIDNIEVYDLIKQHIEEYSKYSATPIRIKRYSNNEKELNNYVKRNNNIYGLIINYDYENYISASVISNDKVSNIIMNPISNSLNRIRYDKAMEGLGLSSDIIDKLNASVNIDNIILVENNNKDKNDLQNKNNNIVGVVAVIVFTMPFFFIITTLVQMIGAEINEEKSTKAMEVIIGNISPKEHLIAKIISCTSFTILQILLLVIYTVIGITIRNNTGIQIDTESNRMMNDIMKSMIDPNIVSSMVKIIPLLIIFLVFTLITYAILAGVLASMTTNIDDFQQLQTPIMLTISIGFYLSILASIFEGAKLIKFMSYLPLVSFMLSPSLYMLNQVSIISVIVSLLLQIVFTFLVYKYGLKVYKVGILNYSGDHLWKKIFKAIKS